MIFRKVLTFSVKYKELKFKDPYPNKELLTKMAKDFSEDEEKLKNWFNHQRKLEVNRGSMKFEVKLTF